MKKRILALFLALTFLITPVPVRAEEKAAELKSIEEQIQAFADSHDPTDAVSTASMALAMHGITGGGKTLKFDDSSAMAALLLHSEQFQDWMVRGCTGAIRNMQQLDLDHLPYLRGWCSWDSGNPPTALSKYQDPYHRNKDWTIFSGTYSGGWNDYDRALEWMVGISAEYMQVTRTQVLEDRAVYQVEFTVKDTFDFDTASNSGFKEFLSGVGMLMFQEYNWECRVNFTLEVPYSCPHGSGAYRWTYDPETQTMTSDGTGGYTENNAEHRTSTTVHYHALEETVRLFHDHPWVLEYDVKMPKRIPLTPLETTFATSVLSYQQLLGDSLYMQTKSYDPPNSGNGAVKSETVYSSSKILLSSISTNLRKKLLTYHLENEVYPDGSNMIFLTITDPATGEVWADRIPLDDYYESRKSTDDPVLLDEESDWLSGRDFYINYIGNKAYYFAANHFELRIWENGIDGDQESYYQTTGPFPATCTESAYTAQICAACGHTIREYGEPALGHRYEATVTAPTCTEQGFTTYSCHCGDSYSAEYTDALGHDLTDWSGEISCTEGGTEERHCRRCGFTETRTVEATGHHYESTVIAPGCTEGGYTLHTCANCGSSYKTDFTNPNGHSFGGWYVVKDATLLEEGIRERSCAACGKLEQRPIPRLENTFTDVKEGDYFYIPVLWAVDRGITNGTSVTRFSPDKECTRAQVVTFLWRAAGCPEPQTTSHSFTDLKPGEYYEKAVLWAVEKGITNGTSPTTFRPDKTCTRGQVVTFLWRAAECLEPESTSHPFTDLKPGEYYEKAVLWAVETGITNGTSPTTFSPDKTCTRGQVVTFLYRAND